MRGVVQRCSRAAVTVGGEQIAAIGSGMVVLVGVSGLIGTDRNAKLLRVETVGGKVLLDIAPGVQPTPGDDPTLIVATLDFLAAGGRTPEPDAR